MAEHVKAVSPFAEGRVFRIWSEEVPWFFGNIRQNHRPLWAWSERVEPEFRRMAAKQSSIEWGTLVDDMLPHVEAAMADLEAGRVERPDRGRILPKWSDGSYRPA